MELKHIKELMAAMGRTGATRLTLKKENFEITIEREQQGLKTTDLSFDWMDDSARVLSSPHMRADQTLAKGSESGKLLVPSANTPSTESEDVRYITSPMVGTFYPAPSPKDAPFIRIGDVVEKDRVVCIIEAMKVMNELKANLSGTILEVLVESGQPVEFGTRLFKVSRT